MEFRETILSYINSLKNDPFTGWTKPEIKSYNKALLLIEEKIKQFSESLLNQKIKLLTEERDNLITKILELQNETIKAKQELQDILNEMFGNMIHTKCPSCDGTGRIYLSDGKSVPCDYCYEKGIMTVVRILRNKGN